MGGLGAPTIPIKYLATHNLKLSLSDKLKDRSGIVLARISARKWTVSDVKLGRLDSHWMSMRGLGWTWATV